MGGAGAAGMMSGMNQQQQQQQINALKQAQAAKAKADKDKAAKEKANKEKEKENDCTGKALSTGRSHDQECVEDHCKTIRKACGPTYTNRSRSCHDKKMDKLKCCCYFELKG